MTESTSQSSLYKKILARLSRPVSAPVVDIFRIASALLVIIYYGRLFGEFSLYTSETGLLDHRLHRELFWFTKISLFFPGSSPIYKIFLLSLGLLGAISLLLGVRPKLGAAVCWLVTVSLQRWNFAVINVDDSSITLLLWWMLFLPIGQTLTYRSWSQKSLSSEVTLTVDGFFVRAFFGNLFIYYLTAGLSKLLSVLWQEGLALYVILNLPLARTQGLWQPEHVPFLVFGNYFTLVMEPIFPFLVLLRKNHPLKWLGGISWLIFHLSIPLTIGVPYANFGLILALILVFHEELGEWIAGRSFATQPLRVSPWKAPRGSRSLICGYLLVLFLAMQKNVPVLEHAWEPAMATLYLGGIAQEYHLFDWIDKFNWSIEHEITVELDSGEKIKVESERLFPHSVRGFIVQSYLLPMRWMRVPRPLTGEMRVSVLRRAAERFVRENRELLGDKGTVVVTSRVGRLTLEDLRGEKRWAIPLMTFTYHADTADFVFPEMPSTELGEEKRL